jgi:hypothetical protein
MSTTTANRKQNNHDFIALAIIIILFTMLGMCSCTHRLHDSHGEKLHNNAYYGSPNYHPYHKLRGYHGESTHGNISYGNSYYHSYKKHK